MEATNLTHGRLRLRWAALVVMAMVLAGCGSLPFGGQDSASGGADSAAPAEDPGSAADGGGQSDAGAGTGGGGTADEQGATGGGAQGITSVADATRSIIYRVELGIHTEDVAAAARRAASLTRTAGGYVERESTVSEDRPNVPTRASLTLRVPVDRHEAVVEDLAGLGDVVYRDGSAQDVTEELVDVTSRIASQQAALARLRALLARAQSLSDVVVLEREVSNREAELDSLQRRQKQLSGLADLATIAMEISTPDAGIDRPERGFLVGLDAGWAAFTASLAVAMTVLGALVPWTVLALLLGIPLLTWWRSRRRSRRDARLSPPPTPAPVGAVADHEAGDGDDRLQSGSPS